MIYVLMFAALFLGLLLGFIFGYYQGSTATYERYISKILKEKKGECNGPQ